MVKLDDEAKAALQPAPVPSDLARSLEQRDRREPREAAEPSSLSSPSAGHQADELSTDGAHGTAGELPTAAGFPPAAEPSTGAGVDVSRPEARVGEPEAQDRELQVEDDAEGRPSFVFFGVVAAVALVADIVTKVWAEVTLTRSLDQSISLIEDHLSFTLAYNQGGAWGFLSTSNEALRKPFFLVVSTAAIIFIVSLYARLHPKQRALKWGLPLVFGGALGNFMDRMTRSEVIDFIDYEAAWVMDTNAFIAKYVPSWTITSHWPTFNIADVAICIGVALMAVDMLTHTKPKAQPEEVSPGSPSEVAQGAAADAATPNQEPFAAGERSASGMQGASGIPSEQPEQGFEQTRPRAADSGEPEGEHARQPGSVPAPSSPLG